VPDLPDLQAARSVSSQGISDPSTWKTRGSPPGAPDPAVMLFRTTKLHQAAGIVGGPYGQVWQRRSFRNHQLASLPIAVATQLQHGSVGLSSKSLNQRLLTRYRVFFRWLSGLTKWPK
jgi:hypothetical protein